MLFRTEARIALMLLLADNGHGKQQTLRTRDLQEAASWPDCYVDKNCDNVDFTVVSTSLWHSTLNDGSFVNANWQAVGFGGSQAKNTNFAGANLAGAACNHMRFDNAVLTNADLTGTNFEHTRFTGADTTGATSTSTTKWTGASFDASTKFPDGLTWLETSFFATDFGGLKLILDYQDVSSTDMATRFANYDRCSFTRIKAHGTSFQGCTITNTAMWQLQAEDVDFSNTDLSSSPMHYSNLRRANFANAILANTGLKHSNLEGCNMVGSDLSLFAFDTTTRLLGCEFDSTTTFPDAFDPLDRGMVNLEGPVVISWPECYDNDKNCDDVDFTLVATSLWGAMFNDGSFVNTNWQGVGFGGSTQAKNTNFAGANLAGAACNHMRFDNAVLTNADLTGTNFEHTRFTGADTTGATSTSTTKWTGASFDASTKFPDGLTWLETSFFATDFGGLKLILDYQDVSSTDMATRFANYDRCSFTRIKAHGTSFQGCTITNTAMWAIQAEDVDFSNANLSNSPMHYSNLKRANFANAIMTGTGLKNTNLEGCNMVGADISQADLDSTTRLIGCTYDSTTILPPNFDPISLGMINLEGRAVISWPECYDAEKDCDGVDFTIVAASLWHATLNDGSFVGSNWQGVGLGGAQAVNTNFTLANLAGAACNHMFFDNAILVSTDLSGTNFEATSFQGADLSGATYSADTNFHGVSFDSFTIFPDGMTWLETSFFPGADIGEMIVVLADQDISGMDLSAHFTNFTKSQFSRMTAQGSTCTGCDLTSCAMYQVKASYIVLDNSDLSGSHFGHATLERASLVNTVLDGTDLTHCNLVWSNLRGADLSTANLTGAIFDYARYDSTTKFPLGFDPDVEGMTNLDMPTQLPTPAPTMIGLDDLMTLNHTSKFDQIPCFPMGMNLGSVVYYSNQLTFKNSFAESGGCCWPVDAQVDLDGNLLQVDEDTNDYWIAGRNIVYRVDGQYPGGSYVLRASGNGTINLAFDVGQAYDVSVPTPTEGVVVNVNPTAAGVQLTITDLPDPTDPVRDISFMLQEFDAEPEGSSDFSPIFTETLSGMHVLRFMDLGRTNNNNIAHWSDRNTKSSFSQSRVTRKSWDIASVGIPTKNTVYSGDYSIEITTTEPHDLVTGQTVEIEALVGNITVSREGESDMIRDLSDLWFPKTAEVTGPNTFFIIASDWSWDLPYTFTSITDASADRAILQINPGVALEYMIDMSVEVGADPWFCVPHLATNEYVTEMATMIANSNLGPDTTAYIELSNEVWNSIFTQQWHAEAMKRELGLTSMSTWYGQRSKEVFAIFEAVFAATPNAPILNRVLATQSVSTWVSERVILGAGGSGTFDSLATAPYFSARAADIYALGTNGTSVEGVTVTDVLELCLETILTSYRSDLLRQREVASKYGGTLVAYEGGQHLGGQGPSPLGGKLENDQAFQDLMISSNRDPRMHNLYQLYFKLWGELVGGVFAHFSFIGQPSKWGSWGVKETYYSEDTVEDSPKWVSVKGINDYCNAQ